MKNMRLWSPISRNSARWLVALALALTVGASAQAQAQVKLAVIDLRKVFDDYHKTKAADSKLKERATDLEKERKALMEDYQKATDDYKKSLDDANDQALSAEEREKRKKAAEGKLLEIRTREQTITDFDKTARTSLDEQRRSMREKILGEIRAVVNAKAKSGGLSLVVDVAAESINQTPVILFTNGENDLTTEVLAELNANAPASMSKPDEKKAK